MEETRSSFLESVLFRLTHPEYENIVVQTWSNTSGDALHKLSNLLMNLSPSSKISLAISSRKKVHMELAVQPTSALIQFEKSLQVKYDQLVHREEILWFQKSRENWVKLGNKNTKFFHTQTIIQRRRNKVTGLFIADTWCTDPRLIK